jgi:hypothetical protein
MEGDDLYLLVYKENVDWYWAKPLFSHNKYQIQKIKFYNLNEYAVIKSHMKQN